VVLGIIHYDVDRDVGEPLFESCLGGVLLACSVTARVKNKLKTKKEHFFLKKKYKEIERKEMEKNGKGSLRILNGNH